jgi:hypothetical protein
VREILAMKGATEDGAEDFVAFLLETPFCCSSKKGLKYASLQAISSSNARIF